jgi:hypothetical protein
MGQAQQNRELGLRGGEAGREKEIWADNKMLDRRAVELVLISLLAAFCGGLAWALDHELFAVVFAAAAVTGERRARLRARQP